MTKRSPFRYFKTSPEIIRLSVMLCVRYLPLIKIIVGPLLQGTPQQRVRHALTGSKPHRDTKLLQMLGPEFVSGLQTAQLRRWHAFVREEVGAATANRVMSMLKGILALAEEDFGVRFCSMPTNLAKRKTKPKKGILTPDDVAKLIAHAKSDKGRGIFYAFPFLYKYLSCVDSASSSAARVTCRAARLDFKRFR